MKNEELDGIIKKANCKRGINYLSTVWDGNTVIFEVYLKSLDEYKVTGIWNTKKAKLPDYAQIVFDELKNQGLNEDGCWFIALGVTNEEESKEMMKYLISVREKQISYTELWIEKNKILKNVNPKI